MQKKELFEMLKDIPDDATILIPELYQYNEGWYWSEVTCFVHNPDNTVELYTGDTDND
jgi:hypothetical protein